MDTSRNEINYLTMHFGGLQVSPKQMANLNRKPLRRFVDRTDPSDSAGRLSSSFNWICKPRPR